MYLALRGAWFWGRRAAQRGASPLAKGMWLTEISGFKNQKVILCLIR
ncbi:hypothetical protein [Pseudomonas poae]|nr:hypothetical protein [Pseudomonas poae]